MNLCQYLSSTASVNPNKVLAICGEQRSTASVLAARVAAISASLVSDFGVEKGDRVVLAALNSDLYLEVVLGVFAAGAVVAPLNWRWSLQVSLSSLTIHYLPVSLVPSTALRLDLHLADCAGCGSCLETMHAVRAGCRQGMQSVLGTAERLPQP